MSYSDSKEVALIKLMLSYLKLCNNDNFLKFQNQDYVEIKFQWANLFSCDEPLCFQFIFSLANSSTEHSLVFQMEVFEVCSLTVECYRVFI